MAWGDYDNDGDLDILLAGENLSGFISRVYRNDRGTFTVSAGLPGARSVAWGDYDNDGDLDILLTGVSGSEDITRIYRNDGGTFTDIEAGLPGVQNSSMAWGDYDNDGDLDILLTGLADGVPTSRVYRNDGGTFNQTASSPTDLSADPGSMRVTLSWTAPADKPPPLAGLSYNLRVGTTPGAADVVAPMSFSGTTAPPDGLRKVASRGLIQGTSWTLKGLTPGTTYYWSVQTVNHALVGSDFATEASFTTASFTTVEFSDIEAGLPGVESGSVAWGDYDNDGDLDLLLTGRDEVGPISRVYRNDDGTFNDIEAGLPGVVW